MRPEGLDHVALYAKDPARAAAWYRDVLGLRRVHEEAWGDMPIVMAGEDGTGVAIFPARGAHPVPAGERSPRVFAHVAFRVAPDALHGAIVELRAKGIAFEEQDHAIARSIYLHDPDGHQVEITAYGTREALTRSSS